MKEYRQLDIDYFGNEPHLEDTLNSMAGYGWDIQHIFNPRKYIGTHDIDSLFVRIIFVRSKSRRSLK